MVVNRERVGEGPGMAHRSFPGCMDQSRWVATQDEVTSYSLGLGNKVMVIIADPA